MLQCRGRARQRKRSGATSLDAAYNRPHSVPHQPTVVAPLSGLCLYDWWSSEINDKLECCAPKGRGRASHHQGDNAKDWYSIPCVDLPFSECRAESCDAENSQAMHCCGQQCIAGSVSLSTRATLTHVSVCALGRVETGVDPANPRV